MRHRIQAFSSMSLVVFLIASVSIMSCDQEEELSDIRLTGQSKMYILNAVSNSGLGGTLIFEERTDHSTLVTIYLDGSTSGTSYPAHFYANSMLDAGDIIVDLNSVDGTTGKSETVVFNKNNGNKISFDQLLALDAHVRIAYSETDFATLIAQADIGGNEVTGTFTSYTLSPVLSSNISGTVRFTKRVNGTTLVVVELRGASTIGSYRAFIRENDAASGGLIVVTLNPVHGGLGNSSTNVSHLNDGTSFSYDQLLNFDGHVQVIAYEFSPNYVAQSNIGIN